MTGVRDFPAQLEPNKVVLLYFINLQHLLSVVLSGSTDNRTRGSF